MNRQIGGEQNSIPNPGCGMAVDQGCTCPVLDNHYGEGLGNGRFVISVICPLHGKAKPVEKGRQTKIEEIKRKLKRGNHLDQT